MKSIFRSILALCVVGFAISASADYSIYSNSNPASDLNYNFSPGTMKIGDEIVPAGGGVLTHIDFQYYLTNSSGNESVELWLYANDGASILLGNRTAYEPSSVLFNSGPFNIGSLGDTTRSTLNYDVGSDWFSDILIPAGFNLTLAIQFTGIEVGEEAGVSLYDFPTVGSGYNSYWEFNGGSWVLSTNGSTPNGYVDFGMNIQAVPEPTVFSLLAMGGLAVLGFGRIFRRK